MFPGGLTVWGLEGREGNPYTRAYLGISRLPVPHGGTQRTTDPVAGYSVTVIRKRTVRQRAKMARAMRWASAQSLQRLAQLDIGSAGFLSRATPTVGQLMEFTQHSTRVVSRPAGGGPALHRQDGTPL